GDAGQRAAVRHLAARFGVERGPVEDHAGGGAEAAVGHDLGTEGREERVGVEELRGGGHGAGNVARVFKITVAFLKRLFYGRRMADLVDVDSVIIGSGAGGLTAALALANAGQKVLGLEQHYLPGGWCPSFSLSGYRFSPGVHYIGEMGPGGRMRAIYEGLGLDGLTFCELHPDGYDHVLIAGERFDIPKGKDAFTERLVRRFPDEEAGIRAYMTTVDRLSRELNELFEFKGVVDALTIPFRGPTVALWGLRTADALIKKHAKNPILRGILAAQAGDHGLPPSLAPAAVHASITAHYFDGGYYPRGGAAALPRAYIRALRKAGGEI